MRPSRPDLLCREVGPLHHCETLIDLLCLRAEQQPDSLVIDSSSTASRMKPLSSTGNWTAGRVLSEPGFRRMSRSSVNLYSSCFNQDWISSRPFLAVCM